MKPTSDNCKKHQELINDISTEDIINAAWDCKSSVPCYECLHYSVCNKHGIGASAIGLALLRLMELNERVKTLESDRDEWKAKAEALIFDLSGHCEYCAFRNDCAKHDNNDSSAGFTWWTDCNDWEWHGLTEKESK